MIRFTSWTKYMKARQEGGSSQDAVRFAFRSVGPALTTTTLVFAAGFAVFGASDLVNNRALGLLVALIIVIALLADFLSFSLLCWQYSIGERKDDINSVCSWGRNGFWAYLSVTFTEPRTTYP